MTKPATGRYLGTTMKIRPPHYAGGKTSIAEAIADPLPRDGDAIPTPEPETPIVAELAVQQRSTPLPTRTPAHAVSGVERLLQQARGGNS